MTSRSIIGIVLTAVCCAALCGLVAQGRQLSQLRAEQRRLEPANQVINTPAAEAITTPSSPGEVPRELLQLRAEVARLSQQQRELAGARQENERLRLQLENRRTNNATARRGTGTYIRMSTARWVGYNMPEDTLQSLFWAVKNHNPEKFLEAVTSEAAEEFRKQIGQSDSGRSWIEGFPPGFAVMGREQITDDTIALRIQFVTSDAGTEPPVAVDSSEMLHFKRIAGQWKLSKTH